MTGSTDNEGDSVQWTLTAVVSNALPVARVNGSTAAADADVTVGQPVSFSAAAISDPDGGSVAGYEWEARLVPDGPLTAWEPSHRSRGSAP